MNWDFNGGSNNMFQPRCLSVCHINKETLTWLVDSADPKQVHLIRALRLPPSLHPGCVAAAQWPRPPAMPPDSGGRAPQHLAPLQDAAGLWAAPSAATLPQHHHRLPQEDQRRLHHGAELRQPAAGAPLPLQRGAGGRRPQGATSVRVGGWGRRGHSPSQILSLSWGGPPSSGCVVL